VLALLFVIGGCASVKTSSEARNAESYERAFEALEHAPRGKWCTQPFHWEPKAAGAFAQSDHATEAKRGCVASLSLVPGRPGKWSARQRLLACMDKAGWKLVSGSVDGEMSVCLAGRGGASAGKRVALVQP
jgi:hypothetical protein